jgi:hypothetical protein
MQPHSRQLDFCHHPSAIPMWDFIVHQMYLDGSREEYTLLIYEAALQDVGDNH